MNPKMKLFKQSFNILAIILFFATCVLLTRYNSEPQMEQFMEFSSVENDFGHSYSYQKSQEKVTQENNDPNENQIHNLFRHGPFISHFYWIFLHDALFTIYSHKLSILRNCTICLKASDIFC